MPRCSIGLGGNIGDVAAAFATALQRLQQSQCAIVAVSRLYVTRAVGPHAGDDFHNACALLDTRLAPADLLQLLHEIEDDAGRKRAVRWGSRSLDIDILTYGDLIQDDPQLTLPHPGLSYRRFVLDPLAEIAPELIHPVLGRTVDELRQRLLLRPLHIVLRGQSDRLQSSISNRLVDSFAGLVSLQRGGESEVDHGAFVIDLDPDTTAVERPSGTVLQVDPAVAESDPVEAAVAVVTAMLDEPQPVAELD